jgi:hypothetical protein
MDLLYTFKDCRSKIEVLEQRSLKKAVFQGFSLKNRKSQRFKPAKTNRGLEQAQLLF